MLRSKSAFSRTIAIAITNGGAARRPFHTTTVVASGGHDMPHEALNDGPAIAAGREYVAYFVNGEPCYQDRLDYPFPAIRFRKPDAEYNALRQKEKGDWKSLSLDDKKKLYRLTFRATLAEFDPPTGHWKAILAGTFAMISLTLVIISLVKRWIMRPNPWYFSEEAKNKQLELMINVYAEPITGIASKWDYEKNVWKG